MSNQITNLTSKTENNPGDDAEVNTIEEILASNTKGGEQMFGFNWEKDNWQSKNNRFNN